MKNRPKATDKKKLEKKTKPKGKRKGHLAYERPPAGHTSVPGGNRLP